MVLFSDGKGLFWCQGVILWSLSWESYNKWKRWMVYILSHIYYCSIIAVRGSTLALAEKLHVFRGFLRLIVFVFKIYFYLNGRVIERSKEERQSDLPSGHSGWSWAFEKPEARSFFKVSQMDTGAHRLEPSFTALLGCKQRAGSEIPCLSSATRIFRK